MNTSNKGSGGAQSNRKRDILASVVVFLVALPLCMGIAIACGVPPALGLITGIVGGLVAGSLSGCPLQVSGPAAGLTVLVYELVTTHGLSALGIVVLLAGLIQLAAGFLKLGRWFRAVSPAVIKGMLAGIGVLIVASQFHVMFDSAPRSSGLANIISIPVEVWNAVTGVGGSGHMWAGIIGLITLVVIVLWKKLGLEKLLHMPGHLPAIVVATLAATFFSLPVAKVNVPANLIEAMSFPTMSSLGSLLEARVLLAALTLALIASAETLLSATAVDQMHQGPRTNYNKELMSQGIGNMLCGFFGALPMTGVIARSTVNVQAGGTSRLSTALHGVWILLVVMLLPFVLAMIPIASLAALLVYTGFHLVDLKVIRELKRFGTTQLLIYAATVGTIVAIDLLTGVLIGFTLSLVKLVWTMSQIDIHVKEDAASARHVLTLRGTATFLALPQLAEVLDEVPAGAELHVKFDQLVHIDHACIDLLERFAKRHQDAGGKVVIDWTELLDRFQSPATNIDL